MTLVQTEPKGIKIWSTDIKKVTMRPWGVETQLRPVVIPDYLCFTAGQANSTIGLRKQGTPNTTTLETSTDMENRSTYSFWTTITLSNVWDKIYRRNASDEGIYFSSDANNYYRFYMSWNIAASLDLIFLLKKNSTETLQDSCFRNLFSWCTALTTAPQLPATTLGEYCYMAMFKWCTSLTTASSLPATTLKDYCYRAMFQGCTSLTTIPSLPATTLTIRCYYYMFLNCTNVKFSTTKGWIYQTAYRIPTSWTGTAASYSLGYMINGTWWSFTSDPSINTTYYTSNTVV